MGECCKVCKFFLEIGFNSGQCRRYPPQVIALNGTYLEQQPPRHGSDWCGEYKPNAQTVHDFERALQKRLEELDK